VKQRHRQVADVIGGDVVLKDQAGATHDRHPVREPNGLGVAAGAGREDHHQGVGGCDLPVGDQPWRRGHRLGVAGRVHVENLNPVEIQAVQQGQVLAVDKQDLTVGASDIAEQAGSAPGGVDAAQHVAAQRSGGHGAQHHRGVGEQRADMQRPQRVGQRNQRGRLGLGLRQVLPPRPDPLAVDDRGSVVVPALPQ
jgi:hypothetical protein